MGDRHHLEEFAHPAFTGAGKPSDRRLNDLLGLRLAIATEGRRTFENAEAT